MIRLVLTTILIIFITSTIVYQFEAIENKENFPNILHGLLWASATVATVGQFGNVVPSTPGGTTVAILTSFMGPGVVSLGTSLLYSVALAASRFRGDPGLFRRVS